MNRAMFSGVAGLKTHQTKMDVIGNNIANVNTYGYKSQRAVFSDMFYQTLRGASGGTSNRGGINPSTVGYGSTLAGIQTQMSSSSMQSTGFGLDVAITGEGYLQVMDPDGNIFYTKAGMLDYDSNGYLTDINGNFVLGTDSKDGKPNDRKISLVDSLGSVSSKKPQAKETINGINYTITASNASKYGNVSLTISSSDDMPAGQKAKATITNTGAITVQLNAYEEFESMDDLNNAVNAAITEANGGKKLAAGTLTITADENVFSAEAMCGTVKGGSLVSAPTLRATEGKLWDAVELGSYTLDPSNTKAYGKDVTFTVSSGADSDHKDLKATIGGVEYIADEIDLNSLAGPITLTGGSGSIELTVADATKLKTFLSTNGNTSKASLTVPFLGGASGLSASSDVIASGTPKFSVVKDGSDYKLTATVDGKAFSGIYDGTAGDISLTTGTATDGTLTLSMPAIADIETNLGLPAGATQDNIVSALQNSLTNQNYKVNVNTLTGRDIAEDDFAVEPGKLEGDISSLFGGKLSIMGTSTEFSGEGMVTDLDFYAEQIASDDVSTTDVDESEWKLHMKVGTKTYEATIKGTTMAGSLLLKNPDNEADYIEVSNPTTKYLNTQTMTGNKVFALDSGKTIDVTPAKPTDNLGLSSVNFKLQGGTEGGSVTLDELSSIAIGADGTISVSHGELGTQVAGKISLASFSNPAGLQAHGSNYFVETANSGEPKLSDPGSDGTGALKSSSLEMSNVDLSSEFADMITTQRGFQANSRIITVSDTMLEELINLKR